MRVRSASKAASSLVLGADDNYLMTAARTRFFGLVGPSALETMSVSVGAARRLVGAATLEAIAERKAQCLLRVEEIVPVARISGADRGPSEEE